MTITKINSEAKVGALNMEKSRINEVVQAKKEESKLAEKTKDTVKISDMALAKQRQEGVKNNPETNPAREKRIEELKAQIKSGEFKVDSRAIADKMLASTVQNLLSQ